MSIRNINRYSKLYQPIVKDLWKPQANETFDYSYRLMTDYGIIKSTTTGAFAFLPLGLRAMNKLTNIVDTEMENIGAQKILLPSLIPSWMWEKTNRYEKNKSELFTLQDRHNKKYLLSPTHEESITSLISSCGQMSLKKLPLRLYQISSKWRDEMKPHFGLVRAREFFMKDLYTFDKSAEAAEESYHLVSQAYDKIFSRIGLPVIKCIGDATSMEGTRSHEYHYETNIGEDHILTCESCNYSTNKNVSDQTNCPHCTKNLKETATAEVGHTFSLSTKYSELLGAFCLMGTKELPLVMGSYGLGLSRIFAVTVHILSNENNLRWPQSIAPYTVCIITPKKGSKEEGANQHLDKIIAVLRDLNIDVIIDDRTELTIGRRFRNADVTGFPYIIVIGKTAIESVPLFEVHDVYNSKSQNLSFDAICDYFKSMEAESNRDA